MNDQTPQPAQEPQSYQDKPPIALVVVLIILVLLVIPYAIFVGRALSPLAHGLVLGVFGLLAMLLLAFRSSAKVGGNVDGHTYSLKGPVAGFLVLLVVLFYFTKTPATHTVRFYIEHDGSLLTEQVTLTVHEPGMEPIMKDTKTGATSMELPSQLASITRLELVCVGYRLQDKPPFTITDRTVNLSVIRTSPTPPTNPGEFPSTSIVPEIPKDEAPPGERILKPQEVSLRYRNITRENLTLFLLDVYAYQKMKREQRDGVDPWLKFPFKPSEEYKAFNLFQTGCGWFSFVIRQDGRRDSFLETKNLFLKPETKLTLGKNESGFFITWDD